MPSGEACYWPHGLSSPTGFGSLERLIQRSRSRRERRQACSFLRQQCTSVLPTFHARAVARGARRELSTEFRTEPCKLPAGGSPGTTIASELHTSTTRSGIRCAPNFARAFARRLMRRCPPQVMKLLSTIVAFALSIRVDAFAAIDPVDPVVDPGPKCVDGFLEGVTQRATVPPQPGICPPESLVEANGTPGPGLCGSVQCRGKLCCPLDGLCAEKIPC
jgi:hypothetical protein